MSSKGKLEKAKIPILDLQPEIEQLLPSLLKELEKVIRSGSFILGPNVKKLQAELAKYFNVKHVIPVNSGTDALLISLRALGIGAGEEVITSSFSFFATAEAISLCGAKPVFVDINRATFNLNPALIEEKINSRTRAILPVHLFGQPAQMQEICEIAQKYKLKLLEDSAQAFGASYQRKKVGTIGNLGAFSFFPSKNLGAYGDGGLIVTDNSELAEKAQMLALHGSKKRYQNELIGYNSRLDEIQAAILRLKLPLIESYNQQRKSIASRYNLLFKEKGLSPNLIQTPEEIDGVELHSVYHQYTIRVKQNQRDKLKESLEKQGIQTMIYYPVPIHASPAYRSSSFYLPETEEASKEVLSLPIWPQMEEKTIFHVVESIERALVL